MFYPPIYDDQLYKEIANNIVSKMVDPFSPFLIAVIVSSIKNFATEWYSASEAIVTNFLRLGSMVDINQGPRSGAVAIGPTKIHQRRRSDDNAYGTAALATTSVS